MKGPTHERGHTLDLVITRKEDDLVAFCDTRAFISDHNALHVSLKCSRNYPPSKIITYRSIKSVNVPALCHNISSTLSQCPGTLDEAVDLYNTALKDLMELHAPLKQRSVVDHPNHPWINEHILEKKRERRKAEKKWKTSGSEDDKKNYKVLCNQVKEMINIAKD